MKSYNNFINENTMIIRNIDILNNTETETHVFQSGQSSFFNNNDSTAKNFSWEDFINYQKRINLNAI
jgi:hypothetical protein